MFNCISVPAYLDFLPRLVTDRHSHIIVQMNPNVLNLVSFIVIIRVRFHFSEMSKLVFRVNYFIVSSIYF